MPEGPEHFKAAQFINRCCKNHIFCGKIVKSEVNHRNPEINCLFEKYVVSAQARGKEVMLTLVQHCEEEIKQKPLSDIKIKEEPDLECSTPFTQLKIVFQFGMSGCFRFTNIENLPKHSHLRFFCTDGMILSYEDVRRFGKWKIANKFSDERGPDPVNEYAAFRSNILNNINQRIFQKPICEVLHNQKFFNGIGNYLRAEILFRAKVPPFSKTFDVLKDLVIDKKEPSRKKKKNIGDYDLLEFCTLVPFEVMMLEGGGYDPSDKESDYLLFKNWLQCYYKDGMENLVDHEGRTIWFQGEAGPLQPTGERAKKRHKGKDAESVAGETKEKNKTKRNKRETKSQAKTKPKAEAKPKAGKSTVSPKKQTISKKQYQSTKKLNKENGKTNAEPAGNKNIDSNIKDSAPTVRRSTRSSKTRIENS